MVPAGTYTISVNRLNKKSPVSGNNREAMYLEKIEVPDLGLDFTPRQALSHVALISPASDTEVGRVALGN
jgi:hypothetical protein